MNPTAWSLLAAWALTAAVATFSVSGRLPKSTGTRVLEVVSKSGAIVLLTAVALTLDGADSTVRTWFVVALAFSLGGDIPLIWPERLFVYGLASFLLAHVAYIVGLQVAGVSAALMAIGVLVALGVISTVGRRVVAGTRDSPEPGLRVPVAMYMTVISVMVVSAIGTGSALAAGGALFFYASDSLIGWNAFVHETRSAQVSIMVTYHLGQAGLVLSLIVI